MPLTPQPASGSGSPRTVRLIPHPRCAGPGDLDVQGVLQFSPAQSVPCLGLVFELRGDVGTVRLPNWLGSQPADGLWQHTCAELFVRMHDSAAYQEFNFSPSGQWAAYRFTSERERDTQGERRHPALPPTIRVESSATCIRILIQQPLSTWPHATDGRGLRLGLSLVLENHQGELTYWALHHPRADRPDFHHPDGCVLSLDHPPSLRLPIENLP